MQVIDNIDNNAVGATLELSDLYGCKVPMSVKVLGGVPKSKTVEFASFEHAWCMRRMMHIPRVGCYRSIVTVSSMQQLFVTTHEDAVCFLQQFEPNGVFASWSRISEYYPALQITTGPKNSHNIGLIVRFVCSNNPKANAIREQIRGIAADRWKNNGDKVSRSIACCFWLRHTPNCTSYDKGLRHLARSKYRNNAAISNVLVMTRGWSLRTSFAACRMVTSTRRKTADIYMRFLSILGHELAWQMRTEILLALLMAFHSRLGRQCFLHHMSIDIFLAVLAPLLDTKQDKRIKQYFARKR